MKRAVAIRVYGDPEIGEPLKNALVVQEQTDEVKRLRRELAESKEREAQLGVRVVRDRAYFEKKMLELSDAPPIVEKRKAAQYILIAWALFTLTIREAYRRLDEWVMNPK